MSDQHRYSMEDLHRFADWMNDRGIEAPRVFAAIYAEAELLDYAVKTVCEYTFAHTGMWCGNSGCEGV